MKKVYFGITRAIGTPSIAGVIANLQLTGSRAATPEEVQIILDKVKANATDTLADALRDGTYPNTISVWDKRADARAACANLESYKSPHFSYGVGEFGEAERSVTKPKGWRITLGRGDISAFNSISDGANVFADGNSEDTRYANCLFDTRAAARQVLKDNGLETKSEGGYRVVRVDA